MIPHTKNILADDYWPHRVCVWHLGNEILLLETCGFAIQILARSPAGAANDLSHPHLSRQLFEEKDEMWRRSSLNRWPLRRLHGLDLLQLFLPPRPGGADISCGMVFFMMVAYYLSDSFFPGGGINEKSSARTARGRKLQSKMLNQPLLQIKFMKSNSKYIYE